MAFRTSGPIIKLLHLLEEQLPPAEQAGEQQIGLGIKAPCLQTRTVTPRRHVLHRLEQALEITEQAAFEWAQALRILSSRLHLVERPFPVALVDGLAQCWGAAEVSMGQELDLADAELRPGHRLHEVFDFVLADAVYAHKRP